MSTTLDASTVIKAAEPFVDKDGIHKVRYRGGQGGRGSSGVDADPIRTEVIRHSLTSAADQMRRALVRTAYSPVIYEVLDFATALYDKDIRMLAQGTGLPLFMGKLHFTVEVAVEAVGGADTLEEGDIILYNYPFGTGSHQQDAGLVMPAFLDGELVGYGVVKAHWLDIGGKEPYCTDTVDVFQEGVIFPGVKLYRKGERVDDIYRLALANSRVPTMVAGDLNAEIVAIKTGVDAMLRIIERYGREAFAESVERMFDHGEAVVRSYIAEIPHGRYTGSGILDDDGIHPEEIPFDITVEVDGSNIRVDYSKTPDALQGPLNCPIPTTVSATRIAIGTLAGGQQAPNEGHFRPIEVISRPGSLFHPLPPSPTFLPSWAAIQGMEVIYQALAQAIPDKVPAASGCDPCALIWWGTRVETGEPWADGSTHPVGQGGHASGDGANSLMHLSIATTRFPGAEVWEAKYPWLMEKMELAPDSGGVGTHSGGLGIDFTFKMLEPTFLTATLERTKNPLWGLEGGGVGRSGIGVHLKNDGSEDQVRKQTGLKLEEGESFELHSSGGGGFGPAAERSPEAVHSDIAEGYVSEEHARKHYPQAF